MKSEQQTHSEQQSEHLSEQVKAPKYKEANGTNSKIARAHVGVFLINKFIKNIYLSHTRVKNSVRSVRCQCLKGFEVFAQVFALLFAPGFAVRSWLKTLKNGVVA